MQAVWGGDFGLETAQDKAHIALYNRNIVASFGHTEFHGFAPRLYIYRYALGSSVSLWAMRHDVIMSQARMYGKQFKVRKGGGGS